MNKKTLSQYIGYGVGALGMDLSYGLFYTFLSKYLTDVLYIPALFLMVVTFLARIWDGVNDPMMGSIVDNTVSRFGKYRRWILVGSACNAVALALLFWNPGFTVAKGQPASPGLLVWVAVMYVLWGMTNTMMDIPYWSMVPSLTSDPKQRNLAATVPRAFSGLGQMLIVLLSVRMIESLGGQAGLNAPGFRRWALLCGGAMVLLMLVSFTATGRIHALTRTEAPKERFSLRTVLHTLRQNDQLLVFMLVALLHNTGWYLVSGLSTYYFENVWGDLHMVSLFGTLVGAGQAAGLLLLPLLTRWLERNTVIRLAMALSAAGYLGMFLFSAVWNILPLFAAFGFLGMMGVGCGFVAQTVMLSDIVDYGEYKLGYRADSVVFSMKGFLQKGAYSIQSLVMYAGLAVTHYNGTLKTQPLSAQHGITVMMFLFPPLLTLAALALFTKKYKLNRAAMEDVAAQLGKA
ncbi:MAG: glycoside-pentoside-hexuronide (GPH):cation symporter [Oscillospiraceae bacterium]|jgi:melibiose permease|nr:glycoside-pentoside-hexuronide (GPH):cation symporter [Oscillospiraceae bacterium]